MTKCLQLSLRASVLCDFTRVNLVSAHRVCVCVGGGGGLCMLACVHGCDKHHDIYTSVQESHCKNTWIVLTTFRGLSCQK